MDAIHIDSRHDHIASYGPRVIFNDDPASSEWLVPIKCNFWVQVAYALLIIGPLCPVLYLYWPVEQILDIPLYAPMVSLFLFIITFGGKDSLRAYRRAREHIEAHGKFDERFQRVYLEQKYCARAGARQAAKDLGVAQQLIAPLANSWRII